jgi:hypothetical protein
LAGEAAGQGPRRFGKLDQRTIDEANEEGNALPGVVCWLKMHGGEASAKRAAFGKPQEYALDGSPLTAAAVG